MLGLFSGLRLGKKVNDPATEGSVNRLHYRVTFIVLVACSALVTCLEWVGNGSKISCVMEGPSDEWTIPPNVINTYCFILKSFTLPHHYRGTKGLDVAAPGVGAFNPKKHEQTFPAYYQWVPFVLFFQALLFYFPHFLYKTWEGGKVKNIISGLNQLILDRRDRMQKERILSEYFVDSLGTHNFWALRMLFIEFLNLINVVFNIYFVDIFLQGEFSTYGLDVLNFLEADPEDRIDPMATVFPRVTKCSYYKYGPSGTLETLDTICVLPINIINEKVYVFLWFWLLALAVVTIFGLLYHLFFMITPGMTKVFLKSRTMNQPDLHLDDIGKNCEVGDWKLLYLLSRNMEPLVFGEFLRELHDTMKERKAKVSPQENGKPLLSSLA